MKVAVRYYTKTGNTKRLAEAVAEAVGAEALPLNVPIEEPVDVLFLGNSFYAFTIDPEVREFIRRLDKEKVGRIVNFGSAAMMNSTWKKVKAEAKRLEQEEKVRKLFVREDKPNVIICADDSVKKKITKHKSHKEINFIFAKDENEIRRAYVNDDIDFVILDICYGMDEAKSRYMSIEDIDSAFRHNFSYIKSNLSSLPVYLINSENYKISKDENTARLNQAAL